MDVLQRNVTPKMEIIELPCRISLRRSLRRIPEIGVEHEGVMCPLCAGMFARFHTPMLFRIVRLVFDEMLLSSMITCQDIRRVEQMKDTLLFSCCPISIRQIFPQHTVR